MCLNSISMFFVKEDLLVCTVVRIKSIIWPISTPFFSQPFLFYIVDPLEIEHDPKLTRTYENWFKIDSSSPFHPDC